MLTSHNLEVRVALSFIEFMGPSNRTSPGAIRRSLDKKKAREPDNSLAIMLQPELADQFQAQLHGAVAARELMGC